MQTILLVDDDQIRLNERLERLEPQRFTPLIAADRREALRFIFEEEVDCVIIEENTRGLNSSRFLNLLRDLLPAMPVVIVGKNQEPPNLWGSGLESDRANEGDL